MGSVPSRSAFEWSCLLRHDGDYDQKTRDEIHAHNERLFQKAMDGAKVEARHQAGLPDYPKPPLGVPSRSAAVDELVQEIAWTVPHGDDWSDKPAFTNQVAAIIQTYADGVRADALEEAGNKIVEVANFPAIWGLVAKDCSIEDIVKVAIAALAEKGGEHA